MATALDDDVASLLAGLDGPDNSQVQHYSVNNINNINIIESNGFEKLI